MNISFIIGNLSSGGAERVVSELANVLQALGNDVEIIIFRRASTEEYHLNPSIRKVYLAKTDESRLKRIALLIPRLYKKMNSSKRDVYVSFCIQENIVSSLCNLLLKQRLVISERNAPGNEKIGLITTILRKLLYPLADLVVFQTQEAMNYYDKRVKAKAVIIPNPVKDNLPEKIDYSSNGTICAVGRLAPQKNYPLLIEAFSDFLLSYPNYSLSIYGYGNLENELKQLVTVKNMDDRVNFMGFVSNLHEELIDYDFYVLSSDYEGMPNALMEAMACGLPSISTDCPAGGPKALIKEDNGLLVQPNNKIELVNAMKMLAENESARKVIGNKAKTIREHNSLQTIGGIWNDQLSIVVGGLND